MWTELSTIRGLSLPFLLMAIALSPIKAHAQPRPLTSEWSFDVLRLKNGAVLKGLLLSESNEQIRFQNVHRLPGRPTIWITVSLARQEVDRLEKLSEADRAVLKSRLQELDPKGQGERRRMEQLDLQVVDWCGQQKGGFRYDSDYFSLCSNAPEEIVRRCAVRLEEVYTAYARFLPPRFPGGKPTMITLVPSVEEYQKMLMVEGRKLQNPAFYEPAANRIFCASDLQKLGKDLTKIRRDHQSLRQEIDKQESQYRELYAKKPQELAKIMEYLDGHRKGITRADKHNEEIFQKETRQLFTVLNHEAFHAYVANFVYPPLKEQKSASASGELPHWLNEGLAQIFETALVEAGELRIDQIDKDRLVRAKEALVAKELMPLKDVLKSGTKEFVVVHNGDRLGSDQAYLTSWALTSYLALDRRLLGSSALEAYVRAVNRGENVEEAFAKLVGQQLPIFERDFQLWLTRVKSDGSLPELKK